MELIKQEGVMMTQNICSTFPAIVNKLAYHYGWDQPFEQCSWMLQELMKKPQTEWQAFTYLVETCLQFSDDRELDYLWFCALKDHSVQQIAA